MEDALGGAKVAHRLSGLLEAEQALLPLHSQGGITAPAWTRRRGRGHGGFSLGAGRDPTLPAPSTRIPPGAAGANPALYHPCQPRIPPGAYVARGDRRPPGPPKPGTESGARSRRHRYLVLKGFFQFALSRGHLDELPLPPTAPKRPPAFVPDVYSRDEIRRLLDAIPATQGPPSRMESATMRAMLLLMYGARLRPGEAMHLSVADVDLAGSLLTIRDTKFSKSRLVPVGPALAGVLSDYARWRSSAHPSAGGDRPFFVGRHGGAVHRCTL